MPYVHLSYYILNLLSWGSRFTGISKHSRSWDQFFKDGYLCNPPWCSSNKLHWLHDHVIMISNICVWGDIPGYMHIGWFFGLKTSLRRICPAYVRILILHSVWQPKQGRQSVIWDKFTAKLHRAQSLAWSWCHYCDTTRTILSLGIP